MKIKISEYDKNVIKHYALITVVIILFMGIMSSAKAAMEEVAILNVETVQVNQCTTANQQAQQEHSVVNSGTATGALLGGVVGSQVVKNRTTGALIGALGGGILGNHLNKGLDKPATPQQVCNTVPKYNVSYRRNTGEVGLTQMSSFPTGQRTVLNFCGVNPCQP